MSTQKVKRLSRELAYTATWLAGVLTVTTAAAHNLKTGDVVTLLFADVPQVQSNLSVTVTGASLFTVLVAEGQAQLAGRVNIRYFSAGQTGAQPVFSIAKSNADPAVIQLTALGAGGAAIVVQISNDALGWIEAATITLAAADLATGFVSIAPNWNQARLSITSIGAATSVVATVSV